MTGQEKLRAVLGKLLYACGKVECGTPETIEMAQACVEAQRVLDEPEPAKAGAVGDLPMWQVRYNKLPRHEGELTLAVYDETGGTICRVLPNDGDRRKAEQNVRLLAAAPLLLNTLRGACKVLRNSGMCIHPHCANCKIGECLQEFIGEDAENGAEIVKCNPDAAELRERCERYQGVIRILESDVKLYRERCKVLENYVGSFCKNKAVKDRCGVIPCESCDIRKTLKMYREIKGSSER